MAVYTGAFELRRLLIEWSRGPSGGTQEDRAICVIHLAKLVSGVPDAGWVTADYTAVEARLDTWWTALKPWFPPILSLQEYRWYRNGPTWDPIGAAPANPAERSTARSVVGTGGTSAGVLPPEVAMTITEVTAIRKRWGRVYLPAPASLGPGGAAVFTADGRLLAGTMSGLLTPTVTLFNGLRADGKQPVVWSKAANAYTTPKGVAIGAHVASAYEVTSLQIDNLADTIRSRRFDGPTARTLTALT